MRDGLIIEIAVIGVAAFPLPPTLQDNGVRFIGPVNHYWRYRWVEDGEQVDATCSIDTLTAVARDVRAFAGTGETVAWRYYPTGINGAAR